MAKKTVVEISCDRCPRIEYIDPETTKMAEGLELSFQGEKVSFPELCSNCAKAVGNYIRQIKREGKKEESSEGDPAAPDPQPEPSMQPRVDRPSRAQG